MTTRAEAQAKRQLEEAKAKTPGYASRGELQRQRYLVTGCRKPLSRKVLKRLSHGDGWRELTSMAMYLKYGRIPGRGKSRRALDRWAGEQKTKQELRAAAAEARNKAKAKATAKQPTLLKRVVSGVLKMFGRKK